MKEVKRLKTLEAQREKEKVRSKLSKMISLAKVTTVCYHLQHAAMCFSLLLQPLAADADAVSYRSGHDL